MVPSVIKLMMSGLTIEMVFVVAILVRLQLCKHQTEALQKIVIKNQKLIRFLLQH